MMVSSCNEPALLPPYQRLFGSVTQTRVIRLFFLYVTLFASGSALLFLTRDDSLQIFGLGLILPGGGFFAHADICTQNGVGHLAAAFFVLGAFGFSVLLWFGTGNVLAPPLVWLGTAIWAASMRHGGVRSTATGAVYSAIGLTLAMIVVAMFILFVLARRQRRIDNAYLADQAGSLDTIFTSSVDKTCEMSLEDIQRLRFALDRALQPVEQFEGFEKLDQFQTAALRYQLNFLAYGIALTQARFMPAFGGYMHAAQIALLDKQTQYRVWAYWGLENMWGNLQLNPDPMAHENIMYTGFVALQMMLFQASTGRSDYAEAGRFTLNHPSGKRYAHNSASLIGCMEQEYKASPFYLIACEPNWVYPLCNTIGASAILAHDVQHKEDKWANHVDDFRLHLETEFLDGFGRYVSCRSVRTGLALPPIGGVMPLAMPCFFLNAVTPDLARRQWLLLRRKLFDQLGRFRRSAFWPIDTGNYRFSRASAFTATALAAAELGDQTVYAACMQALEDECPSVLKEGVIHRPKASVWAHGAEIMARATVRDGFKNVITVPKVNTGPRLESLKYPDVLVASAHADGDTLQAVLYAGIKAGIHEVGLAGLQPHMHYCVSGATVTSVVADAQGNAKINVVITGRTCLRLELEGS